jgi:hypothetical protein
MTITPDDAFETVRPTLERLVATIHATPTNQAGLAILVAAFFARVATQLGGRWRSPTLPEVCEIIGHAHGPTSGWSGGTP